MTNFRCKNRSVGYGKRTYEFHAPVKFCKNSWQWTYVGSSQDQILNLSSCYKVFRIARRWILRLLQQYVTLITKLSTQAWFWLSHGDGELDDEELVVLFHLSLQEGHESLGRC